MPHMLSQAGVLKATAGLNLKQKAFTSSFVKSSRLPVELRVSLRLHRRLGDSSSSGLTVDFEPVRRRFVTMAALPGLFPNPESMVITAVEAGYVLGGLLQGYSEAVGKGMSYSKFAGGDDKKKQRFQSKKGMLLVYCPAALLASIFLADTVGFFPLASILESVGASGAASFLEQAVSNGDIRLLLVSAALSIHFAKRVLEVLFVHKFSGTMDAADTRLISTSYASYVLVLLYVQLLSCSFPAPSLDLKWLGLVLFLVGVTGNAYHHWLLSHLRKDGNKKYIVPHGGLFDQLVCPHYVFEMLDFVGIALMSQTLAGWSICSFTVFYLVGRCIQTKKWYLKKVDGFPEDRKILIPKVF